MQADQLAAIARAGLIDESPSSSVRVEGDDPIHRSPMRLGAAASTVLAMVATKVDDIWAAQTGQRQAIEVDLAHAAAALCSMWLVRADGDLLVEQLSAMNAATAGLFDSADGRQIWIQDTQPSLEAKALAALGCEPTREAVAATIAARTAEDVEQLFVAHELTGVIVRTPEEWLAHPAGAALADAPVVEIEQIGDAPVTPLPGGDRPLSGLRVLEDTRVLAGPTIARTLAEFGADVLQVGARRHIEEDILPALADTGHGKRRAYLDLSSADGKAQGDELLAGADVFSQSYRAGAVDRLGLGPAEVAARRPGIVYVSMNCFGPRGPWAGKRGFDGNAMAASGIRSINAPYSDPGDVVVAMNDYCTGYWGAYGVLRALQLRAERGGSYHVRVSLGQTASWLLRLGTPVDAAAGLDGPSMYELAAGFMESHDSPYGRLDRLRPVIQMSETPAHWERPTVLFGTHEAAWDGA